MILGGMKDVCGGLEANDAAVSSISGKVEGIKI